MYPVEIPDRGMVHVLGRMEWDGTRFHRVLKTARNLKLINGLLLEFFIDCFQTMVDHMLMKSWKAKLGMREGYFIHTLSITRRSNEEWTPRFINPVR